jgi:hypothetical protein
MEGNIFYTKGNKDELTTRISQVHTITVFCPLQDYYVQLLRSVFLGMLPGYQVDENNWNDVPTIDALNAFIYTAAYNQSFESDFDQEHSKDIIGLIVSSLKMFIKLKKINFQFTYDDDILQAYQMLLKKKKTGIKKYIYKLEKLEFNLSDMFSQKIIDMLNKVMIYNELIPNSYLDRKFLLTFGFDEYVNFMNMFIGNNHGELNSLDENICDYFLKFPKLVDEQKPEIRISTNYSEE